jgi:lambda family phage portal protein
MFGWLTKKIETHRANRAINGFYRKVQARFDAAQTTEGNERHWAWADIYSAAAANNLAVRTQLRKRARYEYANNCFCNGMVRRKAFQTVGTGPRLQLMSGDESVNRTVEESFTAWSRSIRLADKLRSMTQARIRDGETFGLLVTDPSLPGRVKLNFKPIECDQVTNTFVAPNVPGHVDGIHYDNAGTPTGYDVLKHHPGDFFAVNMNWQTDQIPASDMVHLFNHDRPGQVRGVPEITPALPLFALLRRYTLATISSAEVAAMFALFLKSNGSADADQITDSPFTSIEVQRNTMTTLPYGYDVNQLRAEQPTTTYDVFQRAILREIAQSMLQPIGVASGDSSDYNYSSAQLDILSYYQSLDIDRQNIDVDVLDRVFAAWLDEAALAGEIPQVPYYRHRWMWPPNEDIDPVKAAESAAIRRKNGLMTDAEYFGRRSLDWREVYQQLSDEKKLRESLNIDLQDEPNASREAASATS